MSRFEKHQGMIMSIESSSFSRRSLLVTLATARAFGLVRIAIPEHVYVRSNGLIHVRYSIAESGLWARSGWHRFVAALFYTVVAFAVAGAPAGSANEPETVKQVFQHAIPNIPGKSLIALVVDYPPGAASAPHIHTKTGFIYAYVVSGEIESKVNDGATRVYKAGDSWSEPPGASHSISRNASTTKPAKLLAVFVVDTGDKDLTTPVR